ncbi:NAD(P)+ transhydrogenase beta chain [Neorhizobium petrolearium]|uniref:NAD(P)+ transhydrogenase beta chain n=1 Tax=Neorhizobium petrolearium TaxID=515361 RepID=UPI003F80BADE
MIQKPSYTTSKKALWLSSAMAWAVIIALTIGAIWTGQVIAFAGIALPMMVGLIAVMLGIHRGLGSLDMWTMTRAPAASPSAFGMPSPASYPVDTSPPYQPRDQPNGDAP